jgi:hypothetical protein
MPKTSQKRGPNLPRGGPGRNAGKIEVEKGLKKVFLSPHYLKLVFGNFFGTFCFRKKPPEKFLLTVKKFLGGGGNRSGRS